MYHYGHQVYRSTGPQPVRPGFDSLNFVQVLFFILFFAFFWGLFWQALCNLINHITPTITATLIKLTLIVLRQKCEADMAIVVWSSPRRRSGGSFAQRWFFEKYTYWYNMISTNTNTSQKQRTSWLITKKRFSQIQNLDWLDLTAQLQRLISFLQSFRCNNLCWGQSQHMGTYQVEGLAFVGL